MVDASRTLITGAAAHLRRISLCISLLEGTRPLECASSVRSGGGDTSDRLRAPTAKRREGAREGVQTGRRRPDKPRKKRRCFFVAETHNGQRWSVHSCGGARCGRRDACSGGVCVPFERSIKAYSSKGREFMGR